MIRAGDRQAFRTEQEARAACTPGGKVEKSTRGSYWWMTPADPFEEREAEQQQARAAKLGGYRRLGEVLADRRHVEWLLKDFLERGVIALLIGPYGTYKSALAIEACMRAALAGEVVFILSPEGSGLQRRLQAWLDEFAPFEDPARLKVYARERRLLISAPEEMELLTKWLAEIEAECGQPPSLIAIDTLSKASNHKENDNDEAKALIGQIDRCLRHRTAKPATVLLVVHTGVAEQGRARGAYALTADTDAAYVASFKNGTVTMTRERFKDAPSLPPLYFTRKVRELGYRDPEGNPVTSVVLVPASAPAKREQELTAKQTELLEQLRQHAPITADALMELRANDADRKRDIVGRLETLVARGLAMCSDGVYSVPKPIIADSSSDF